MFSNIANEGAEKEISIHPSVCPKLARQRAVFGHSPELVCQPITDKQALALTIRDGHNSERPINLARMFLMEFGRKSPLCEADVLTSRGTAEKK